MIKYFNDNVDIFLNPVDDKTLLEDTDLNPTKAIGELGQIKYALKSIDELNIEWENLFKICGRYTLNEHFKFQNYDNTQNNFKLYNMLTNSRGLQCFYTCLYKISNKNYQQYRKSILDSYEMFKTNASLATESIELILCRLIEDKLLLDNLGLTVNGGGVVSIFPI